MKRKRLCFLLVIVMCFWCFSYSVAAKENTVANSTTELRASGRFGFTVEAGTLYKASTSFPLEKGDTVTIDATYSPSSATVRFGLITEDNTFRYQSVTGGSASLSIVVSEDGNYTFAIRNTADYDITVNGYVNY